MTTKGWRKRRKERMLEEKAQEKERMIAFTIECEKKMKKDEIQNELNVCAGVALALMYARE